MKSSTLHTETADRVRLVHGLVINGVATHPRRRPLWLTLLLPALARMIKAAAAEMRAHRAARQLAMMDDKTLRDIGIHRSEIEWVVRGGRRHPSD